MSNEVEWNEIIKTVHYLIVLIFASMRETPNVNIYVIMFDKENCLSHDRDSNNWT